MRREGDICELKASQTCPLGEHKRGLDVSDSPVVQTGR